jgi:Protein of unknown function (DUF1666)
MYDYEPAICQYEGFCNVQLHTPRNKKGKRQEKRLTDGLYFLKQQLWQKETRVKELFKKKKGWKSKTWPGSPEEVELVFALIDIKVVARVLRVAQLSKEQLLWCEEKMSKIDLSSDSKLRRDASPILFPC